MEQIVIHPTGGLEEVLGCACLDFSVIHPTGGLEGVFYCFS